jgi:hypothetical protein
MTRTRALFLSFFLSSFLLHTYFISSAEAGSMDFFAGNLIAGKPLEEWAKEYWQWVVTTPETVPKDPQTNLDQCRMGSDPAGIMTFLINPYQITYNSKCTIPSDRYVLVPLLTSEHLNVTQLSQTLELKVTTSKTCGHVLRMLTKFSNYGKLF